MAMDRAEVLGGQEPDSGRVPLAMVRLNPRGTQWIINLCPHCGKRHFHGAGDGDPLDALGHRVGHCLNGGGPVRLCGMYGRVSLPAAAGCASQ